MHWARNNTFASGMGNNRNAKSLNRRQVFLTRSEESDGKQR